VNTGALAEGVFESELFGHVKGAFTDARTDRIGRFELADGGTIFLDEIGNVPIRQQAKLLRVLESGEIERLGSSRTRQIDVRVISATNTDLPAACALRVNSAKTCCFASTPSKLTCRRCAIVARIFPCSPFISSGGTRPGIAAKALDSMLPRSR